MNEKTPVICLDGPSGVGKGTIAMILADSLGWHLLDSGSLYRITALAFSREFPDVEVDSVNVSQITEIISYLDVCYAVDNDCLSIRLGDEDIGEAIRNETIGALASELAAIPEVRAALLERQRAFAQAPGLVADGRDMGTVVFPDAVLKIYLTASPEVRAERRYKQLIDKGIDVNLASLVEELRLRDERDMNRETAPLKPAADAIVIDTSTLDIQQVTDEVMRWVDQRVR